MLLTSFALDPAPAWRAWLQPRAPRRPVLDAPPRVTRLFAFALAAGQTEEVPAAAGRMVVHCRRGQVWLTHDGEARDVVLSAGQAHAVDSTAPLRVTAMAASSLEIEVGSQP